MADVISVVEKLNDKTGSIFIEPSDVYRYTGFLMLAVALFQVFFHFWEFVFNKVFVLHRYIERDRQQKLVFSETLAANCMHLIMQPWSLYILMYPRCQDGDRSPLAPLFDDVCFNTIDKRAVYMVLWLGGYMLSDFYTAAFVIKGKT